MGYMRHHAIVVTDSGYGEWAKQARAKAAELGCEPTDVTRSAINGHESFMVPPDGSKEGWPASDEGDARRDQFIEWLRSTRYDDGSGPLSWAEVVYGDDELQSKLTRSSDEDHREFFMRLGMRSI